MPKKASAILFVIFTISLTACATPVVVNSPQNQSPVSAAPQSKPGVVLYSASWCPHCKEAKEYFKAHNIAYTNRDVEEDADAMETLVEKYDSRSVPVIVLGNDEKILKGFKKDEFEKAYAEFTKGK